MKTITIELTKRGLPALWERGGSATNTGKATVVAHGDGAPKKPVYIRRKGDLSNSTHALIVVRPGDIVIEARHHRRDYTINIWRIVTIDIENRCAELEPLDCFSEGEWDGDTHARFTAAVEAAKRKAAHYHCRSPYYVREA